jgi:hypothetical protein
MSLTDVEIQSHHNPLEVVEHVAALREWSCERSGIDEVTVLAKGQWADYQISFTWMHDLEVLHVACAFDMKIPDPRKAEVGKLIALINEQMWIGHFDLWTASGLVMHRHALVLTGGVEATSPQCETLLATAVEACERYFPAFQFTVWAGKSANEAMGAALFETAGEA